MSIKDLHSEYPTEAQIDEMWAAYKSHGREGILAVLRKRTREWQETEREATGQPASASNDELHEADH